MAEIINIKNEAGEVQYPVTKPECVIDESGKNVLQLIRENGSSSSYDDTEIKRQLTELSQGKEDKTNKVTSLTEESTDVQYPSAKAVYALSERISENEILIEDLQNTKIDKEADDYYPKMAVGLADNLAGVDVVDSEINFRRSGGGAISDGVARMEVVKGNSVVWNQVINADDYRANNSTITRDSDGWYNIMVSAQYGSIIFNISNLITNHQYLFSYEIVKDSFGMSVYFDDGFYPHVVETSNALNGVYTKIVTYTEEGSSRFRFQDNRASGWTSWKLRNVQIIDLTQMFGAGNEPTTIEEFYARIPMGVDLNAYNEGEVIHMDVQSIESQGVNAWDEKIESGYIDTTNGNKVDTSDVYRRSANMIEVISGAEYYTNATGARLFFYDADGNFIQYYMMPGGQPGKFSVPSNACFLAFFTEKEYYKSDICINLSDTSVNGKYFPYIKRVEDLAVIRNYFPNGMKSAGIAHDEIRYNKESGKWEYSKGRLKSVDLGSLTWNYYSSSNTSLFKAQFADIKIASSNDVANMLCAPYTANNANTWQGDKTIVATPLSNVQIWIHDEAYKDNLEAFKAAIQGVILYYEAAEWEWVELDEADQFKDLDYQVWNAGTEKAIAEGKSAPLAADITYGFNAIGKIKELESLVAALRAKVGI